MKNINDRRVSLPSHTTLTERWGRILGSTLLLFILSCLVCTGSVLAAQSSSSKAKTLFLPLKVNTATGLQELTVEADMNLEILTRQYGATPLPRIEAQDKIGYDSWPPDFTKLATTFGSTGTDYVAVGSLTRLGDLISIDMTVFDLLDTQNTRHFFHEGRIEAGIKEAVRQVVRQVTSETDLDRVISTISVSGNKKIDSGAIMQKIGIKSGDPYLPGSFRKALKKIYAMGFFEDVQVISTVGEKGRQIVFEVTEKPVIGQVLLEGEDALKTEDILEVVELAPSNIINAKDIKDSIENIKALYKEEGYYNTEVTSEVTDTAKGKVNVLFSITEGTKVYIKEINFTGNTVFEAKKLKKVLQTSEKGWLSWLTDSGVLNHDIIEQDASRLAAYYHNSGYVDAKVGTPEVSQEGEWFFVTFNISEGERYRVGTVDINGDLIADKSDLLRSLKIGSETFFSRGILRDDVLGITDYYAENGYAFAEAMPVTDKDRDNRRVNITIEIAKQELIHINRIVVRGNSRTRDKVIRREMRIKETGIYNATAIKKSQKRLERLNYFEEVKITPESTGVDGEMDVVVNITEKPTGSFSIGAGYSSVDSFMFMSEVSQNNFMGKGQKMSLQTNISGTSTQYNISFTEPRLADSKLLVGLDLYDWEREYDDYDKDSQGITFRFGYPLGWRWRVYGNYNWDYTTLSNVENDCETWEDLDGDDVFDSDNETCDEYEISDIILKSMDINTTSSVQLGLSRDSRNNYLTPSSGSMHSFSLKYAGGPLGGEAQYSKIEGSTSWYFPLPADTTIHYKLAAGLLVENEDDKLPVHEKFHLGGINTIRGFESSDISPRDPETDDKIGGGKMWYSNLEYHFPLVDEAGLRGLVFMDAGNVYDVDDTWDFGDIKKSAGFGFRWLSPMGPLRLEWGFNLDPQPGEDSDNWDFSIGGSF